MSDPNSPAAAPLAFLDTETVTLEPGAHVIWEIGLILREPTSNGGHEDIEYRWQLAPDMAVADPKSLLVCGFNDRFVVPDTVDALCWEPGDAEPGQFTYRAVAAMLHALLAGRHIVGAVPNFDTERLDLFLRWTDAGPTPWHYHLVDVENLVAGRLRQPPPWDSEHLSRAVGVQPPSAQDRHTALGDARWVRDLYDAVMYPHEYSLSDPVGA